MHFVFIFSNLAIVAMALEFGDRYIILNPSTIPIQFYFIFLKFL